MAIQFGNDLRPIDYDEVRNSWKANKVQEEMKPPTTKDYGSMLKEKHVADYLQFAKDVNRDVVLNYDEKDKMNWDKKMQDYKVKRQGLEQVLKDQLKLDDEDIAYLYKMFIRNGGK